MLAQGCPWFIYIMHKKGLTLLEILVASIILAVVIAGLANIFFVGKKYILRSRLRMAAGELGRAFLDPLQKDVRQDLWTTNCLSGNQAACPGAEDLGITYNPTYVITPNSPIGNLNKVKVTIGWHDPELD